MDRIVVVGANHAGTNAIIKICENKTDQEVVVYDRNDNISFLGCGMALWVGNVIDDPECLFYANPQMLRDLGCDVNLECEVVSVDYLNKKLKIRNIKTNEEFEDRFDKLIIACGSWPITPPIKGIDLENVEILKIFQHAQKIIKKIEGQNIKKVAIIGGGYIGVELAEALIKNGKEVVIVNDFGLLSSYYDEIYQMAMQENLEKMGVVVKSNSRVSEILGNEVVDSIKINGEIIGVDMVILATGFKPATKKFKNEQLEMDEKGAIKVNSKLQSSIENVYAIGDCAALYDSATKSNINIALASNALKSGIVAGLNTVGVETTLPSVQGSNAIYINGLVLASTGIKKEVAKQYNINAESVIISEYLKPDFMPDNHKVTATLVYEVGTNRVIGFQVMSTYDVSLIIHMFSLAIEKECTVHDIYLMDTFFLPHFNQPKNFIMKLAEAALEKIKVENNS